MKTSTILSLPVMAACVLLAWVLMPFAIPYHIVGRGELVLVSGWRLWLHQWPSNILLAVAGLLFLRLVLEVSMICRHPGGDDKTSGTTTLRRGPRMGVMVGTSFTSLLILGAGYLLSVGMEQILMYVSLSAFVAAVGLVAAGLVLACGRSVVERALALFFLLLNAGPVMFAVFVITEAVLRRW